MAFYEQMRATAVALLKEFGNPFTLKKPSGEARYNPKTKKTEQQFSTHDGICVMKAYSAETIGALSNIINAGDVEFICSLNDTNIVPTENTDKLYFGGNAYNIINVTTIRPDGSLTLVYKIQCRKVSQ